MPELILGVPDVERKKRTTIAMLRARLDELLPDYFPPEKISTATKRERFRLTTVYWAKDNPSRGDNREAFCNGSNPDYIVTEKLADILKYDYFNIRNGMSGDTMNLAIGQGEHAYTPLQMLRYTAIIVNT